MNLVPMRRGALHEPPRNPDGRFVRSEDGTLVPAKPDALNPWIRTGVILSGGAAAGTLDGLDAGIAGFSISSVLGAVVTAGSIALDGRGKDAALSFAGGVLAKTAGSALERAIRAARTKKAG
jgi:hypothetical protein